MQCLWVQSLEGLHTKRHVQSLRLVGSCLGLSTVAHYVCTAPQVFKEYHIAVNSPDSLYTMIIEVGMRQISRQKLLCKQISLNFISGNLTVGLRFQ